MAELTAREQKIVELMGMGMTDVRIAMEFHIPEPNFDILIGRIKQKTGLQSRPELEQLGRSIIDTEKRKN